MRLSAADMPRRPRLPGAALSAVPAARRVRWRAWTRWPRRRPAWRPLQIRRGEIMSARLPLPAARTCGSRSSTAWRRPARSTRSSAASWCTPRRGRCSCSRGPCSGGRRGVGWSPGRQVSRSEGARCMQGARGATGRYARLCRRSAKQRPKGTVPPGAACLNAPTCPRPPQRRAPGALHCGGGAGAQPGAAGAGGQRRGVRPRPGQVNVAQRRQGRAAAWPPDLRGRAGGRDARVLARLAGRAHQVRPGAVVGGRAQSGRWDTRGKAGPSSELLAALARMPRHQAAGVVLPAAPPVPPSRAASP